MKYSETWGDPVWRHNMLCLLFGAGIFVAVLLVAWRVSKG